MTAALWIISLGVLGQVTGQDVPFVAAEPAGDASALHVVLIDGVNKDPEEIRSKDRAVQRLSVHFLSRGVPASQVHVLAPRESYVTDATAASDAVSVRATLEGLRGLGARDRLVLYYTGQANLVGDDLRFNLPGPDLTHREIADLLRDVRPGLMVAVFDAPGAGIMAKALAGPNRILVFSARSDQPTSTRFSDFFVPALDDMASDVDGDGHVSLVESFQSAVQQIDSFFRDQTLMKSETALLDDNGDGVPSQLPWMYRSEGNDGAVAARLMLDTWALSPEAPQPPAEAVGVEIETGGAP